MALILNTKSIDVEYAKLYVITEMIFRYVSQVLLRFYNYVRILFRDAYDIFQLFINLIYYTFQDHIAVHKPKTYISNLALGGESSGFDVENSKGLSDMAFATGYQVNTLNTKDIQNKIIFYMASQYPFHFIL